MKFDDVRIGDAVSIIGTVVALKERMDGSKAVRVEYDRRSIPTAKWFDAEDLNSGFEEGAGV